MALLIIFTVAVLAGLGAYELLTKRYMPTMGSATTATKEKDDDSNSVVIRTLAILSPIMNAIERFMPTTRADLLSCREKLSRAGIRMEPQTWRGLRILSVAVAVVLTAIIVLPIQMLSFPISVALIVGAGVLGWVLPRAILDDRTKKRRRTIEAQLPSAMGLLGIAIAAGSPVEQCFREVSITLDGPISEEFSDVDRDVNLMGMTREKALNRLSERCQSKEISAFVHQMVQSLKQGSSVSEGLEVQAQIARETAQADKLEKIRKMGPKLDVIMSLFLIPTVALVLVPQFSKILGSFSEMF